jgi:hypothetical protein
MIFVIAIFKKETLEWMLENIKRISSSLAEKAAISLEEQRKILYEPSKFSDNKPLIARVWDLFIIGMIVFFLKSIIDGAVQEKAIELATHGKVHPHDDKDE